VWALAEFWSKSECWSGISAHLPSLGLHLDFFDDQVIDVKVLDPHPVNRGTADGETPDRNGAKRARSAGERTDRERSASPHTTLVGTLGAIMMLVQDAHSTSSPWPLKAEASVDFGGMESKASRASG
jgi:hypothetical protein